MTKSEENRIIGIVKQARLDDKMTWKDTAMLLSMMGIKNENGEDFSGAGLQGFMARKTGQKKWGRSCNIRSTLRLELKLLPQDRLRLMDFLSRNAIQHKALPPARRRS